VVATNVAETSITIPRIRYVVDTGLARMSRYNPRTRTKRLPVESISQSSANQRAGRAGRVQDGVCIRLYEQEDFEKRPRFTMPEIQRANLAEVILRMKAFKLGEIETFPFINPPVQAAVRGGYELLHELGALGDTHDMTPVGRELARLPVDPTLGRMLLQARTENALAEMLIIAAGLSVPDPRERPEEAKEQAAAAHRAFSCPDSDFLSLLRLWNAAPDAESGSRNAMRKFCKTNFLSLTRMREWRDIWRQLRETMDEESEPAPATAGAKANDDAVHRSVLAGLLGHIALREERNVYKAAGNRQVTIFPGSNLYERREKHGKPVSPSSGDKKPKQPQWIVAGEIVQTSQLFARMVAKIDPVWIAALGAHLAQFRHSEPHYSPKSGRVLVTQRTIIHGLEVERRHVDFGKVDPVAATQIFIREALVEGELLLNHRFVAHNRKLREKIETTLTRVRSARAWDIAELLQRYYEKRIHGVSSVHDLNRFVQDHGHGKPDYLCATEEDLTGGDELACDLALFPDQVSLGNSVLPLTYAYSPGEEQDGVTVQVPLPLAEHLTTAQVQWLVPGLREEQISVLLRALPKALRKSLMPLEPKAREIASEFVPGAGDFLQALAGFITRKYAIRVEATDWAGQTLPAHLQPRVEVIDQNKRTVTAGRDLPAIRATVRKQEVQSDAWDRAVKRVERYAVNSWSFGDLPESVVIEEINGVPVLGFPGLALRDGEVDVRLFRKKEDALRSSPEAVRRIAEHSLGKDIAWLHQELRHLSTSAAKPAKPASFQDALSQLSVATPSKSTGSSGISSSLALQSRAQTSSSPPRPAAPLPDQAREHILAHALRLDPLLPLTEARFRALCDAARKDFPALAYRVRELLKQIEDLRASISASPKRYSGMEQDLHRLVPPDLLSCTPHTQLQHVPRYLKAIQVRAERAALSPAKDESKALQIEDFDDWEAHVASANREAFRWMLEEFRVSIFAPELGTAQKVSAKRLEELWQ
jgi:ATP-dependent helicase HrpA